VTIRDAGAGDADVVAELLGQLGYPTSVADARQRLGRTGGRTLLAESDGVPVGLLALAVSRPLERARPVARVTALVVRDSARRRGVGRALMDRAAEVAAAEGCEGIELTSGIRPEREAAHVFYQSLGFERNSYRFWRAL
jgi:GNAT superfamily N-acetyltransferase